MASSDFGLQLCPTRSDGHSVLFAHKVTHGQCQDRQRGHYHKCWSCVHNNALAARNGHSHPKPAALPAAPASVATRREMRVG